MTEKLLTGTLNLNTTKIILLISLYMTNIINQFKTSTFYKPYEPPHDKNNKMTRAPSENSDQPGWTESSLSAWRNIGSSATHWIHCEDSDQTGWVPRLIWVFAGRTCHFIGFVRRRLMRQFAPQVCAQKENNPAIIGPRHEKTCLRGLRPGKT